MAKDKTVIRTIKRENPFVQVDKHFINDETISFKAKGIMLYLLSKPDDWTIRVVDLAKHATDGEKSIYSGLKELIKAGYIVRLLQRDENGRITGTEYLVFERPEYAKEAIGIDVPSNPPVSPKRQSGKKSTVSPKTACRKTERRKSETTNNDLTNNDDTNNKTMDGRLGSDTTAPQKQKDSSPFSGQLTEQEADQEFTMFQRWCRDEHSEESYVMARDFFRVWKNYYAECPLPTAIAMLRDLIDDQYDFTGNKTEYKNAVGVYHHRMKQWRSMHAMYKLDPMYSQYGG